MGYGVKWIEAHLGITRKALRTWEDPKIGLLPENKNGQYRDYNEEEIEKIWKIKVLQGIGFSLKEIKLLSESDTNWQEAISQKIQELENKKENIEQHLGYARQIKLLGRFPVLPNKMGSIKFEDFQKESLERWNLNTDPDGEQYYEMAELLLSSPEKLSSTSEIGKLLSFLINLDFSKETIEWGTTYHSLLKLIIRRMSLGANHPEIQILIKMMYEHIKDYSSELENLSIEQFSRISAINFLCGDIALLSEKTYGEKECRFIADAIAIFGKYNDSSDPALF